MQKCLNFFEKKMNMSFALNIHAGPLSYCLLWWTWINVRWAPRDCQIQYHTFHFFFLFVLRFFFLVDLCKVILSKHCVCVIEFEKMLHNPPESMQAEIWEIAGCKIIATTNSIVDFVLLICAKSSNESILQNENLRKCLS